MLMINFYFFFQENLPKKNMFFPRNLPFPLFFSRNLAFPMAFPGLLPVIVAGREAPGAGAHRLSPQQRPGAAHGGGIQAAAEGTVGGIG